jgi:hypothetical protein
MEIDVLAEHIDSSKKAYVECKFEKTPLQADVLTKALGNALNKRVPLHTSSQLLLQGKMLMEFSKMKASEMESPSCLIMVQIHYFFGFKKPKT